MTAVWQPDTSATLEETHLATLPQAQTHYLVLETDFHERAVEQADYDVEGDMQTVAIS